MIQNTVKTVTEKKQVITHQGRVCFFDGSSSIPYHKLTPQKEGNRYKISCYPNYQIEDDKLILESARPSKLITANKVVLDINLITPSSDPTFNQLNNSGALRGIGQLLTIYIQKHDPLAPDMTPSVFFTQGTCFLTKLQASAPSQVVSVFHAIDAHDIEEFDIIPFANFTEADYGRSVESIREDFGGNQCKLLISQDQRAAYFLEKLKEKNLNSRILSLKINKAFLKVRRDFISKTVEKEESIRNFLLDPVYNIKPNPAVDLAVFDIDIDCRDPAMNIPVLDIGDLDIQDKDVVLVMFACPQQQTIETKDEYSQIFMKDTELNKAMSEIPLTRFLWTGKSASYGQIYFPESLEPQPASTLEPNPIILFYGSATVGASGGPLLNHRGQVIAVNFANFSDKEEPEAQNSDPDKLSDNQFDVKVNIENTTQLESCKNCNLSISMRHPVFKRYLEEVYGPRAQEQILQGEDIMVEESASPAGNFCE